MADPIPPVDLASLAAGGGHPEARWRLNGEDLQANLIRLDQGDRIQPHRNDELEVLVVVVSGRRSQSHARPGYAGPVASRRAHWLDDRDRVEAGSRSPRRRSAAVL